MAALGVVASTIGRLLDAFAVSPSTAPSRDQIARGLAAPCVLVEGLAAAVGLDLGAAIDAKIARAGEILVTQSVAEICARDEALGCERIDTVPPGAQGAFRLRY